MDKPKQRAREDQLVQSPLSLRRRLTEAEDTLEAIRGGEVDAVVVEASSGPQIYTLESPDQPFRVFIEQMQEGALTLNADGTIIYSNRFFADLVERPLKQVRGQAIQDFVAVGDQSQFQSLFELASQGVVRGECRLCSSSGADFPVQLAFNPLPPEELHMSGVVVTDLTERERAKKLEAQRLAAEEANAARDQFLAVVSHELRTPLNAILGWAQLLRRQNELSAAAERGLEIIERSAWSQSQLIDDLSDVSRVLAGKLRLDLRTVDLNRIIELAVGGIQPTAETKQIALEVDLAEPSLRVKGDADRLQQVIANLLSNAVKFTPEKGRVDISLDKTESGAELTIRDTGIGVPAEFLPRLFDLYQQIEGSTTRRAGGLGLGLAIVKQLTELHGGKVWAESQGAGKGATFTLRLPLIESSAVGERQTETAPLVRGSALESLHLYW
ncbi:MAG: PAS domain-containing sensor histidine kinase [Cellvibrionaceae bacterium]